MPSHRTLPRTAASALLGVTAVTAAVTAAIVLFAAWTIARGSASSVSDVGAVAAALIGFLLAAFGVLAAVAALDTWVARPRGHVLGLLVGLVTALAALAVLATDRGGSSTGLLALAIGLGVATGGAVALDAVGDTTATEAPR